jgi:hypothetical protein
MVHAIRASAAIKTFLHRSMTVSARNCTALNPLKQLPCQIPTRFSPNRRIHTAFYRQPGNRTSPHPKHCRYGAIDLATSEIRNGVYQQKMRSRRFLNRSDKFLHKLDDLL